MKVVTVMLTEQEQRAVVDVLETILGRLPVKLTAIPTDKLASALSKIESAAVVS